MSEDDNIRNGTIFDWWKLLKLFLVYIRNKWIGVGNDTKLGYSSSSSLISMYNRNIDKLWHRNYGLKVGIILNISREYCWVFLYDFSRSNYADTTKPKCFDIMRITYVDSSCKQYV